MAAAKRKPQDKVVELAGVEATVKARLEEIETALEEIIETIEHYFGAAEFLFIEGGEACPGQYAFREDSSHFSFFGAWTERWMGMIEPITLELQEKGDPGRELMYYTQRFGFYLGVLVGAKSMGTTAEQLRVKARALVREMTAQERYRAVSDAKSQAKGGRHAN